MSRSTSATWAGYLLIAVAVLAVVDGLAGVVRIGAFGEATNNAYQHAGIPASARLGEAVQADLLVGLAIAVVYGVAVLGLGLHRVFDLGGRTAARIATWLLAGLGVLWFGYAMSAPPSGSLVTRASGLVPVGVDLTPIRSEIAAHTPGWVIPFQATLSVVNMLILVAVIVLLALPSRAALPGTPTSGTRRS